MRRFDERPVSGARYINRPGVYVILPQDGKLLLTLQQDPMPELQLPGGGVDPGESPLQALHREVMEETGWRIASPRRLGAFRKFAYMPEYDLWAEKICAVYVAQPVRALGAPTEPGHSVVWSTPEEAAENLANTGDRHFVKILAGLS